MILILTTAALAGWTKNSEENDCVFYVGELRGDFAPVRAECDWPLPADKIQRVLAQSGAHQQYFSAVEVSKVLGPAPGGGELVYQEHKASGISNREAVLVFGKASIPGGVRYTWTRADDQSRVTGAGVLLKADTGMWEITATPTGSHVVYELLYDPGGSVPGFLVRWFQGAGVRTLVGELRSWVVAH